MKKRIYILLLTLFSFGVAGSAQTIISGYLDADATNGITGAPVPYNFYGAVNACRDLSITVGMVTYNDWYLPSHEELVLFVTESASATVPGCLGSNCTWNSVPDGNWVWTRTQPQRHATDQGGISIFTSSYAGSSWASAVTVNAHTYVRCVR